MLRLQGWNTEDTCFGTMPKPIVANFKTLTTGAAIENYLTQNFGNTYNLEKSNISKASLATSQYGPSLWYGITKWPYNPVIVFTFRHHIPKLVTLKVYTPAIGNTTNNGFFSIYGKINRPTPTNAFNLIWANKSGIAVTTCQTYNYMVSRCPTPTFGHDNTDNLWVDNCLGTWNTAGIKTLWCYFVNPYGGYFGKTWGCTDQDLKTGAVESVDIVFSNPRTYPAAADGSYPAGNYTSRVYLNSIEFAYEV